MRVKRTKKTTRLSAAPAVFLDEETDDLEQQEEDALRKIAAAVGDDPDEQWEAWVRRVDDRRAGPKPVLFEIALDALDTIRERLRQEYGNGRYRVQIKKNRVTFTQFDLAIEMPIGWKPPAAAAAVTPSPENDTVKLLLDRMASQDRKIEELLQRTNQPAAGGMNVAETLRALKDYHDLTMPKGTDNGIQMFREGMSFMKEAMAAGGAAPSEGGGTLERLATKLLDSPLVAGLVQQVTAPPAAPPAPAAAPPAIAPPAAVDDVTAAIDYLVAQAAAGVDPSFCTGFVLERMPANILDAIETHDDPFAALAGIFPQVAPHRAWFTALMDTLYESEGDDEPDRAAAHPNPDPGRAGGNARGAQANAGPGAPGAR